jgi:PleD family two-component response regulator
MELIDGLAYLMGSDTRGQEWVSRYSGTEICELFNDEEQKALARGQEVIQPGLGGSIRWVDMIAASRMVR